MSFQATEAVAPAFNIQFPRAADLDQDEEWFEFEVGGEVRRLRIHDYEGIYAVPGLYEALVYERLQCTSPARVAELLTSVLEDWPRGPEDLRMLDLGAGNGIVAEEFRNLGTNHIVGLDLLPEAAAAARRDRPDAYDDYLVADLCGLSDDDVARLRAHRLNTLVTVAALGFGDIPPLAFANAYNFVAPKGWIAMTIKEDFLDQADDSGFSGLVRQMIELDYLSVQAHRRYCHRISIRGEQLFYVVVVGRKNADIPVAALDGGDLTTVNLRASTPQPAATSMLMGSA